MSEATRTIRTSHRVEPGRIEVTNSEQFPPAPQPPGLGGQMQMSTSVIKDRAPRGALLTGVVFLVISMAGCGFGAVKVGSTINEARKSVKNSAMNPSGSVVSIEGDGGLALAFGTRSDMRCEVRDDNGNEVLDNFDGVNAQFNDNDRNYYLIRGFTAKAGVSYQVMCWDDLADGDFAVVKIPDLKPAVSGLAGFGVGAVCFLIGGVFLIVGLVRRGKWKRSHRDRPTSHDGPMTGVPPAPGAGMQAPPPSGYDSFPTPGVGGTAPPPPMPGGPGPGAAQTTPPPMPGGPGPGAAQTTPPPPPPPYQAPGTASSVGPGVQAPPPYDPSAHRASPVPPPAPEQPGGSQGTGTPNPPPNPFSGQ